VNGSAKLLQHHVHLVAQPVGKARSDEVHFYQEAAEFLSHHGFNALVIDNDDLLPETNISRLVQEIQRLNELRNVRRET
jgi:hypothetical protein